MTIQWFPGHMAKARRQIEENLNLVDLIIELVDARAPISSQNPMLQKITKNKPNLLVLMKSDLADMRETQKWISYFKEEGISSIAINVNNKTNIQQTIELAKKLGQKKSDKLIKRGIQPRALRAMV